MSDLESGEQLSPDDVASAFGGDGAAAGGGEAAEATASDAPPIVRMLRSTEPQISPEEVGRQLDIGAEWWQHYGAGFIKSTGSDGTEAWMHFVMGTAVLVLSVTDPDHSAEQQTESDGTAERSPGMEPDGEQLFEGPQ
jgi:hypothetical protein